MISHTHRCIFIHIPKTGGCSIERVLWPGERTEADLWMGFVSAYHNKYQTGGLQHLLARQIRQEVGEEVFRGYFKFAFVRNPWDKAVSQYSAMKRRPDLREFIGMHEDMPFGDYLDIIQRRTHVQWQRQLDFLRDEDGSLLVDFVGRFETIETDAQKIFAHLGLEGMKLPHENSSAHRPYREYYDESTRERLRQIYAEDIKAFTYSFDASNRSTQGHAAESRR